MITARLTTRSCTTCRSLLVSLEAAGLLVTADLVRYAIREGLIPG